MMPAVSTVRCERETLRGVLAGQWCVIHFGQHAALFRDDAGHLLVVSDPVRGLVPDGVQIAPADLRALLDAVRSASRIRVSGGTPVSFATWAEARAVDVDLRLTRPVTEVLVPTLTRALSLVSALPALETAAHVRAIGPSLVAVLRGRPSDGAFPLNAATILEQLIGAGPGATPTGDDVVVGILAAAHLLDDARTVAQLATHLPPLLGRTTSASAHDLAAALQGRFSERLHGLVRHANAGDLGATIRSITAWGASSGADTAAGLLAHTRALTTRTDLRRAS